MRRVILEKKIIGNNPLWISISLVLVFILISFLGGDLINFSILGFEVIFPFYSMLQSPLGNGGNSNQTQIMTSSLHKAGQSLGGYSIAYLRYLD